MGCDRTPLIPLHFDGELDPVEGRELESHLRDCAACGAAAAEFQALRTAIRRDAVRHTAPPALVARLRAALAHADRERETAAPGSLRDLWRNLWTRPRRWIGRASALAGTAALASALTLMLALPGPGDRLESDLVAGHIRSLMEGHLIDVPSSDQHTVRPWFAGRLDIAPPVPDLADHGFVLEGGRLDFIDGHPAAALVYRKGRHRINLFVWSDPGPPAAPHLTTRQGYALLRWAAGGLGFCAVSDINVADLRAFQERYAAATPTPEPGG